MKLGMRTIKSAIGAGLAIWIAEMLSLNFGVSAAVLTVLCIERTRRRSIRVSFSRFVGCIIGLLGSALFFEWIGYHPLSLTLFLLLFVPILVSLRIQEGFVTSVVVILHIYTLKDFTVTVFGEEVLMITIGIGVAMGMNSFMPNLERKLNEQKDTVEDRFRSILSEFSVYMEKGDQGWSGNEFLTLEKTLREGKQTALLEAGNQLWTDNKTFFHYFDMRQKQYDVLLRMASLLSKLTEDNTQRKPFATFLDQLSQQVKSDNTAPLYRKELQEILENMKEQAFPVSREEFETRATVLQLIHEMDLYLSIKITYYTENNMKW